MQHLNKILSVCTTSFITFLSVVNTANAEEFALKSIDLELQSVFTDRNDIQRPNDSAGDRIDVKSFTGNNQASFRLSADFQLPFDDKDHQLRISYVPYRVDGKRTPSSAFRYDGVNFNAGVPTTSDYKFDTYRLTYSLPLAKGLNWAARIGGTLALRDASTEFDQVGSSASFDNRGIIPLLFMSAEYALTPKLSLKADFDGFPGPRGGGLFDGSARLQYKFLSNTAISAGYRLIAGGVDNDDFYNSFRSDALTAGLSIGF